VWVIVPPLRRKPRSHQRSSLGRVPVSCVRTLTRFLRGAGCALDKTVCSSVRPCSPRVAHVLADTCRFSLLIAISRRLIIRRSSPTALAACFVHHQRRFVPFEHERRATTHAAQTLRSSLSRHCR